MDSDKGLVLGFLRECGALELPQLDHDMFQPVHREATSRKKKMATFYLLKQLRSPLPRYQEIRRNGAWEEHVTKCLYKRGEFVNRYHMSIHAFTTLVRLLHIQVNHKQSQCASGGIEPIDSNIVVACSLQWLAGNLTRPTWMHFTSPFLCPNVLYLNSYQLQFRFLTTEHAP